MHSPGAIGTFPTAPARVVVWRKTALRVKTAPDAFCELPVSVATFRLYDTGTRLNGWSGHDLRARPRHCRREQRDRADLNRRTDATLAPRTWRVGYSTMLDLGPPPFPTLNSLPILGHVRRCLRGVGTRLPWARLTSGTRGSYAPGRAWWGRRPQKPGICLERRTTADYLPR
jgi:hypothetical protein